MIEAIVNTINENIARRMNLLFGAECEIQAFGLAFPVSVTEDMSNPFIVLNTGEVFPVFFTGCPAGLYHRLDRKIYEQIRGSDGKNQNVERAELHMICWGESNILNMSSLDFEQDVVVPAVLSNGELLSADFDTPKVISGEFGTLNVQMSPEEFVFSLKYSLKYILDY